MPIFFRNGKLQTLRVYFMSDGANRNEHATQGYDADEQVTRLTPHAPFIAYLNVATIAGVLAMKVNKTTMKNKPRNKPKLLQSVGQFPFVACHPSSLMPFMQEQLKKY